MIASTTFSDTLSIPDAIAIELFGVTVLTYKISRRDRAISSIHSGNIYEAVDSFTFSSTSKGLHCSSGQCCIPDHVTTAPTAAGLPLLTLIFCKDDGIKFLS